MAQTAKNLPAVRDTWVWSLGWEDPLEKGMAPHSRILAWKIPWRGETGGLQSMGLQRVRHDWATNTMTTYFFFFLPPDTGRVLRKHLCKIHSNPRHIKCEERRLELRKYGNVSASFFSIFMCQSESPRLHVPVTLLHISYGSPLKQLKTWSKVNVSNNYNTINGNFIIISCGVYKSRQFSDSLLNGSFNTRLLVPWLFTF